MADYNLSPSSINLFLDCPKCFWLLMTKKIRRPEGIFPSLPNGMDRVLKAHFDKFMETGSLPPEIKEYCTRNGYRLFDDAEKLTVWRNNFNGIQYVDEASGVLLRGAIDNLLVKSGKLIVLDYKTRGYPVKDDTHEYYQTQLDIYNFLLRKNGYETEDYAYLLFYHPTRITLTGEVVFHQELKKINTSIDNAQVVINDAINLLKKDCPESAENCGWCAWQKKVLYS